MILKLLNEKIYKSLTDNLFKASFGNDNKITKNTKCKEKTKEKINEVKCTKCNNKNVQCIQQLITNIGIDLLTLPNHYNFNEDIL